MARPKNVLITCARFEPSTGLLRALNRGGARVDIADSLKMSPALHSNAADQIHVLENDPARDPLAFVREIAKIVEQRDIDLVVPAFEEGFYLANYADQLPVPLFAPSFSSIERLHHKARFAGLCQDLGLGTPDTVIASSNEELSDAIAAHDEFVARPAFSRGGDVYLTNHGPRAGETKVDDCVPSGENPWLVQPYVEGDDACSLSIVRDGKVLVHCVYGPSISAMGGYSVQFTSIPDFGSLEMVSKICGELNYNGFIGIDYRRTPDGVVMLECNPRCAAGIYLIPQDWVAEAVFGEPAGQRIVEPGVRRQYDASLLERHVVRIPATKLVHELLTTPDALMTPDDVLPAFYFWLYRRRGHAMARRQHMTIIEALISPVAWDGAPMPELPSDEAKA